MFKNDIYIYNYEKKKKVLYKKKHSNMNTNLDSI